MSEDGWKALEAQLGAPAPPALNQLSSDELLDLATAVRDARRRQAAELAAAGEQALNHIPKLLRGPIRRAVA